jgi:hypothetical protein
MRLSKQSGLGLITLVAGVLLAGCAEHSLKARSPNTVVADRKMMTSAPMSQYGSDGNAGGGESAASNGQMMKQDYDGAAPVAASPAANGANAEEKPTRLTAVADSAPDRYLIKNATVAVEVGNVKQAAAKLVADAKALKGYVSDMHESVDSLDSRTITVQVRVPAREFDGFMQQFEGLGKVQEKQVTTQDVTEEFVDSQSRLRNLKATELRLLDHLHRTGKLSDTLLVETELTRVRQELEQLEGRLRFLAHRVDFSTIAVTLRETAHIQALTPPQSFSSGQVASEAIRSLVGFGQSLWTLVIWIGLWSVVWLPPVLAAYYLVWKRRRHRGQRFDIPPVP